MLCSIKRSVMSRSLFLESKDFQRVGNTLTISYKGFCLNLFYSKQCRYCENYLRIFNDLKQRVRGAAFAITNVDNNPQVVQASIQSTTEIEFTPFIVFYFQGIPLAIYDTMIRENADMGRMMDFLNREAMQAQSKLTNTKKGGPVKPKRPAYCLGNPKTACDNGVCYLSWKKLQNKTYQQ